MGPNRHPDHDTMAVFPQQQLPALAALFTQVLGLYRQSAILDWILPGILTICRAMGLSRRAL
jgi:hypothetical protein